MFKKIMSLGLVAAISAGIAIGGTVAYLTDRDSEANVFTVGNVSIELNEKFKQGADLVPGVRVEKAATITNTGDNDAWVWMTVAVPAVLDDENTELGSANVLHWNMPGCFWNGYHDDDKYIQSGIKDGYLPKDSTGVAAEDSWINDNVAAKQTIDGIEYNVYTFKYVGAIVPGETTNIGLSRVFLDENLDIDPDGQWYIVENGVATKVNWNSNTNGTPIVYVSAYAMQKDQFDTVQEAYEAYNTQWGNNGAEWGEPATVVTSADELIAALAADEDVVLTEDIAAEAATTAPYGNNVAFIQKGGVLDGGGNTLTVECSGDDYGIMTYGGTIKNLIIDEGCRAIVLYAPTEDVILDNVHVAGDVLYPINTAEHPTVDGIDLIVSDSSFGGWTSFAGIESASFTDCNFVEGNYGYGWPYETLVKPYVNTVFEGCDFAEGYYLDLSALGADCKVTLDGCTVNGTAITAGICGFECDGTEPFCVELPGDGRTLADCVIFK